MHVKPVVVFSNYKIEKVHTAYLGVCVVPDTIVAEYLVNQVVIRQVSMGRAVNGCKELQRYKQYHFLRYS